MKLVYAENGWVVYRHLDMYLVYDEGAQVNEKTFFTEAQAREWTGKQ